MIKVHRIEVHNIRSFGHAVFEPLVDGGMTAINGPNGVGKTSLLVAMVWAMYGVTPDGVPQTAMRRQGSTEECRVVVEFEHEGRIITVERGLKGRKDAPYLRILANGVEQVQGKIRAGEAWIVNLLGGLDSEGFLTAFVIRQKELDGLVKAKPAARRALIERLAGIDRMSTAVKTAREEETDVKRRIETLPGDPEALKAAREAVEDRQNAAVEAWETFAAAEEALSEAREAYEAASEAATVMQSKVEAAAMADQRLTAARHALDLATTRAQSASRELDTLLADAQGGSAEEVTAAQQAHDNAADALQRNTQAREHADRAVAQERQDAEHARRAAATAHRAQDAATQARDALAAAESHAASFPSDVSAQADAAEATLTSLNQRVGALRGDYERLTASIKAMEATNAGDFCCPTCSTTLPDPSLVLQSLRETRARVGQDGVILAGDVATAEENLKTLRGQQAAAAQAQSRVENLRDQARTATETAETAAAEAEELQTVARHSAQAATEAKNDAMSAAQQTQSLNDALNRATQALRHAQVASAAAGRVPAARDAATTAAREVETCESAVTAAETDQVRLRVDPDHRARVEHALQTTQVALSTTERVVAETQGAFRVAEEQVKSAERVRDNEALKMRARAEAYELLEQKTAVKEALDYFRKDRIASLAPELSEIATDLIGRMTDGRFTSVELDEEFTPVVTDANGTQRPAAWLSGGEESSVALSLRLAIGEVIAGQQGGLLWMDEPQTAMDAARRPAMMSVVRSIPGRQPILTSHVSEATDMVDLVVEVVGDDEEGSTVVLGSHSSDNDDPSRLAAIA